MSIRIELKWHMELSVDEMAPMSRLLDEALLLDAAQRAAWPRPCPSSTRTSLSPCTRRCYQARPSFIGSRSSNPSLDRRLRIGVSAFGGLSIGARVGPTS